MLEILKKKKKKPYQNFTLKSVNFTVYNLQLDKIKGKVSIRLQNFLALMNKSTSFPRHRPRRLPSPGLKPYQVGT